MQVLIAEDDPVTRRLLEASLGRWKYEVVAARDGREAWEILQRSDTPRLAILNWMMPGMDGVEICRELRKRSAEEAYIYALLLTSKTRKAELLEGFEAGADDYLIKPFDPRELQARLRTGHRIVELQNHLIDARESLRLQATHDALTGLWNRAAILDILERELVRSRRQAIHLTLILADLDFFKHINDRFGHQAGDIVLREVARRMRSVLRPYDAVGRYGGEEFIVVVPACEGASSLSLAERIRAEISSNPILTPEEPVSVTVSLGVATVSNGTVPAPDLLIRAADLALYRAKQEGRNRSTMAQP
jgi:two-component system cell cycle response regulator